MDNKIALEVITNKLPSIISEAYSVFKDKPYNEENFNNLTNFIVEGVVKDSNLTLAMLFKSITSFLIACERYDSLKDNKINDVDNLSSTTFNA